MQLLSHNLRAGEVVATNVGSFDGRLITILETKNKQPRLVPLSRERQAAIEAYLDWRREQGEDLQPESALILSHHQGWEGNGRCLLPGGHRPPFGHRLSYHSIYFAVEAIGEIAELPGLHPHQFRHTGATELLRMGMDPAHARRLTGHTDERSFRRYTLAAEQEAAIDAFYRAKEGSEPKVVITAQNLNREQRQCLTAMAELTGQPPLYQDDFDRGEINFEQLWQENVTHLEHMLANVKQFPGKYGFQ